GVADEGSYAFDGSARAGRVVGRGVDASDVRFKGKVTGKGKDAKAKGTLDVARVAGKGFAASDVRFTGDVADLVTNPEATGTASVGRVTGQEFDAANVRFTGRLGGRGENATSGELALDVADVRTVRVGEIRAKVTGDENRIDLAQFSA